MKFFLALVIGAFILQGAASSVFAQRHPAPGGTMKMYKPQSAVAAHMAFSTISASDPAVQHAVPAANTPAADKVAGKQIAIQGTVVRVMSYSTNDSVTLEFALNFRTQIVARILPAYYSKLPNLNNLNGKRLLVTGKVSYAGKWPQIAVTSPSQMRIIQ